MNIILVIGLWLICLWVLYLIIKGAIDGSEMAKNISAIRSILSKQYPNAVVNDDLTIEQNYDSSNMPEDECPACHSKVLPADNECPSCGLRLGAIDSDN